MERKKMGSIQTAIILVAGLGNRLKPLTNQTPKCLVPVNGKPILFNALNHLANHGITKVVLVVGHLADTIRTAVGETYRGMTIEYVYNPLFEHTNNMYSLWLARDSLEQGVLLLEGDVFFEEKVLSSLLNTEARSYWAADAFSKFRDGCMLTSLEDNSISRIEIVRQPLAEYSNNQHKSGSLLKILPELGRQFSRWLSLEVKAGNVNIYYDLVLAKHLPRQTLFIHSIRDQKWMEIDTPEDLEQAQQIFFDSSTMTSSTLFRTNQPEYCPKWEIVPISKLKPLEQVFPHHLRNLNELILKQGIVTSPLLVDRNTGIVLDGSHRYIFFLMHGYEEVPVHYVDYNDENIRVGTHLMHRHLIDGSTNISKAEVVRRGLSGEIYTPRTTRHFFPFRKIDDLDLPLSRLKKSSAREVSRFIAPVTVEHEIAHNENFIDEIEQEIDEIINYLSEARKVKNYLKYQVEEMKKKD